MKKSMVSATVFSLVLGAGAVAAAEAPALTRSADADGEAGSAHAGGRMLVKPHDLGLRGSDAASGVMIRGEVVVAVIAAFALL